MRWWRAVVGTLLLSTVAFAGCVTDEDTDTPHARIVEAAMQASADLDTIEEALAAGYQPDRFCVPGMGVHWINPSRMDTELDPASPEVLLFEPSTSNFTDPAANRFLGVEYLAVTEGTEHNTSQTVPTLLGEPLDGPMPGHAPGMPWHAELHVYLAEDVESTPAFEENHPGAITCPEGTTPPPPGGSGSEDGAGADQDANNTAPPPSVEVQAPSATTSVHRTVNATFEWTIEDADDPVANASLHWAEQSVDDPGAGAYGNSTAGSAGENGTYQAAVTVPGAPNASGTLYLRAHATVDGEDRWSREVSVPIEALEVNAVTISGFAYDPGALEVQAPAYVVWTNEDSVSHTVTFQQLNGTQDNELADLGPGESVGYVFTATGSFPYRCTHHSADYGVGMSGNVTVTAAPE